jgi:hypothetical protein
MVWNFQQNLVKYTNMKEIFIYYMNCIYLKKNGTKSIDYKNMWKGVKIVDSADW